VTFFAKIKNIISTIKMTEHNDKFSSPPKINAFYQKVYETHFPKGQKQIDKQAKKIIDILNNKPDFETAKSIVVKGKCIMSFNNCHLYDYIKKHFGENLDQKEIESIISFLMFDKVDEFTIGMVKAGFNTDEVGYDADEIPDSTGDFGKCETNPVPTKGIMGSREYLERLRNVKGDKIKWKKITALKPLKDKAGHPIDVYEIFTQDNEMSDLLFFAPYNKRISNKAPYGYTLEDHE